MARGVKIVDKGYNAWIKRLRKGAETVVAVGVQNPEAAEAHPNSDLTVGELAAVHEFGSGLVPSRSFVRSTFDDNRSKYEQALKKSGREILKNRLTNVEGPLLRVGEVAKKDMVRKIEAGIPPALSAATAAKKGSDLPLVDTGTLIDSITAKVRK